MTKALNLTIFFLVGVPILILVWVLLDWFVFNRAEPEVHLIPGGYTGPVIIAFDIEGGAPEKYEDGKRVYEIPSRGVLETQFSPNPGSHQQWKFYYVSKKGDRSPIPYDVRNFKNFPIEKDKTVVFSIHMVSTPSSQTEKEKFFFTYVVGKVADAAYLIKKQHETSLMKR